MEAELQPESTMKADKCGTLLKNHNIHFEIFVLLFYTFFSARKTFLIENYSFIGLRYFLILIFF